jgi:hypothetical protein
VKLGPAAGLLIACAAPVAEVPDEEELPFQDIVASEDSAVATPPRRRGPLLDPHGAGPLELARTYTLAWEKVPRVVSQPVADDAGALSFALGGVASSTGLTHLLSPSIEAFRGDRCSDAEPTFVRWESFPPAAVDPATLRYSRFEGMSARCRVRSRRAFQASVPALVPGLVYAFKTCDGAVCDAGARPPGSIVLVAPEPTFVDSIGAARPATNESRGGSFARVDVPLPRGRDGGAAATLSFTGADVLAWRTARGLPRPKVNEVELSESRTLSIRVEATTLAGETELRALVRVNGAAGRRLVEWLDAAPSRTPTKETP